MKSSRRRSLGRAGIALVLSASPIPLSSAYAQTPPAAPGQPPAGKSADAGAELETVVVTAQRRSEAAQSVPIALQAFSGDELSRAAVRNTEDLTTVVSSLMVVPAANIPALFLRGVGTSSSNTTPAVMTFVDGVYMPFGSSIQFSNVGSIEVLKGPQGTLFGRNATGGVIQITTKPPSETPGGNFEIGYGNYKTYDANGYVTGGIAPGVAMDLAVRYNDQQKGFGHNIATGANAYLGRSFSARSRVLADLTSDTTFTFAADYSHSQSLDIGSSIRPAVGFDSMFVGGALEPASFWPGPYDVNLTRQAGFRTKEWGVAGTLETKLTDVTLRSITAYRRQEEHIYIDFDGSPADLVNINVDRAPRTSFTQEVQALSSGAGPFQWVVGYFFYRGVNRMNGFRLGVPVVNFSQEAFATDADTSNSLYAQGSYELATGTKLTIGVRGTIEKRSIVGFVTNNGIVDPTTAGELSATFREPTWRFALDHKLTSNNLIYASVSHGFNTGFYNESNTAGFATEAQNPLVDPEFLTAYEVGTKNDFFDRRLRVNLSAFWDQYKNMQQQIYDQGAVRTINAGASRIRGVEFEILGRPIPPLTLSINATYLDTKYLNYPLAPNYVLQPNGAVAPVGTLDAAGKAIINAPKWSYTATATYVLNTPVGDFTTSGDLNYRGKTFGDPQNRFPLATRYVLNLTERWTSKDQRLFASLWAKNLANKNYDYSLQVLSLQLGPVPILGGVSGVPAPPRTYGVTVGCAF